jgi:hypothetical protein
MDAAAAATTRDVKVISLIGVAHLLSHVYHLALPALFPLIHAVDGISYARLGVLSSVFFVTSGLSQAPAGFLVDRVGARPVLIGGMFLITGASALFAFTHPQRQRQRAAHRPRAQHSRLRRLSRLCRHAVLRIPAGQRRRLAHRHADRGQHRAGCRRGHVGAARGPAR